MRKKDVKTLSVFAVFDYEEPNTVLIISKENPRKTRILLETISRYLQDNYLTH
jgi:hypothetical protein